MEEKVMAVNNKAFIAAIALVISLTANVIPAFALNPDFWTLKESIPYPIDRDNEGAAVIDGKIYLIGNSPVAETPDQIKF